jgi:hypothetical protein
MTSVIRYTVADTPNKKEHDVVIIICDFPNTQKTGHFIFKT